MIDPSAAGLRQALRALGRRVQNPRIKDVRRGIGMVRKGIAEGTLTRAAGAVLPNAEREWGSYSWDVKAAERGKDEPLKRDDHFMDAKRYGYSRCIKGSALVTDRQHY